MLRRRLLRYESLPVADSFDVTSECEELRAIVAAEPAVLGTTASLAAGALGPVGTAVELDAAATAAPQVPLAMAATHMPMEVGDQVMAAGTVVSEPVEAILVGQASEAAAVTAVVEPIMQLPAAAVTEEELGEVGLAAASMPEVACLAGVAMPGSTSATIGRKQRSKLGHAAEDALLARFEEFESIYGKSGARKRLHQEVGGSLPTLKGQLQRARARRDIVVARGDAEEGAADTVAAGGDAEEGAGAADLGGDELSHLWDEVSGSQEL